MFLKKVLRTLRSTWRGVNTGPVGEKKAIKYSAIFIAICLSLVIFTYNLCGRLGEAETAYNQGVYLQQQGLQEEAIAEFDKAIHREPQHIGAYSHRGYAHLILGHYELSIQDYDEAIRLGPQIAEVYIRRGGAYFSLGQYEQAIQDYDTGIRLNPQLADAYINRGGVYFTLGQNERAIHDY